MLQLASWTTDSQKKKGGKEGGKKEGRMEEWLEGRMISDPAVGIKGKVR